MKVNADTPDIKELKAEADGLGIEYPKTANTAQMLKILEEAKTVSEAPNTGTQSEPNNSEEKTKNKALEKKVEDLEKLVRSIGDQNKIRKHDHDEGVVKGFSFNIKLFPTRDGDYPIIKWETISNYVARSKEKDDKDDQVIEVTYMKDGKGVKQELSLMDFITRLKRSEESIFAKTIKNWDGKEETSDVYIDEHLDKGANNTYFLLKASTEVMSVTFDGHELRKDGISFAGESLTILSTYLNA